MLAANDMSPADIARTLPTRCARDALTAAGVAGATAAAHWALLQVQSTPPPTP